ncbi:protein-disulfide reductase DsbD [Echinimonas agarilytica]|uniref:Thiol:disulfide interchange protein DsbD n=1 Tax=Echinimonas agarilytica TaxID=1215918 RepID=A0AA41W450_9GAMM|nr:protein-disulfide reductase DsbD [Echinimonas agarilytica]MCM2678499.1 protein-disulfide reductase DsbD [Echinimonas agarilytica]
MLKLTRHISFIFSLLAALCSGLFIVSTAATANPFSVFDETPEFLQVDDAFQFEADVISPGKVEIFWTIESGYYLYKDKIKLASPDVDNFTIEFPDAVSHDDEFFGVTDVYYHNLVLPITYQSDIPTQLTITYMGCAEAGLCYPPTSQKISLPATAEAAASTTSNSTPQSQSELAQTLASGGALTTLGLFFLLGLGLAFTPCVFPMYPILSGVISGNQKRSKSQAFALSFSYVQGMALTYTLLGLLVASFGMQLQAAFQHPAVLIGLSVLFGVLALSMFGVFNLQLPRSWQDALQSKSQNIQGGRYGSVFLLGVIAGLVASPCTTAPLSAALLYVGQSGDLAFGGLALYLLSMGMGLPLLIIGTLGARLLPKNGAWMNVVKHIFGFVTLAVPVFLLERIVPETTSMLMWALLLLTTGGYLLFALREAKHPVVATLAYMITAVLLFSAVDMGKSVLVSAPAQFTPAPNAAPSTSAHIDEFGFITVVDKKELEEALAQAKLERKAVLLDFYADWCVACKEFDKYTFPDANVQTRLADMTLIRIDVTASTSQDIELLEFYSILGLPSLLLFDALGEELVDYRIAGFLKPEPFVAHINKAFE